jgi:histidine ammonia-lyase
MKKQLETFLITIEELSVENINYIIQSGARLELSKTAEKRIVACRQYLDKKMEDGKEVFYGINTGFGSLCNTVISTGDLSQLQENLVKSHACGMGEEVHPVVVKIMLLLKIQGLSYGNSGVSLQTVQRLIDFYNNDILPVVFEEGSLGASGDLAPLAHLSLPLLGMGYVDFKGQRRKSSEVLTEMGWKPVKLQSKEGLALLNGTQFMSAHAVYALIQANRLSHLSDIVAALSLEAFDGQLSPFGKAVNDIRPHRGQVETAKKFRDLLHGSQLINSPKVNVQDPYSFRCIPQVHGASKDTIRFVESTIEVEINAVTDNPTIFPEDDIIVSAGNFHGQPLALAMDFLCIALAELGSISERRTYKLIGGTRGLPSFLVKKSGLNSGFMIAHYACASVVSKNKQLCTPASVDTIDSSQGQEDHVSMGANAAVKCLKVVENLEKIIAIELLTAAQAIEFRNVEDTAEPLRKLHKEFRKNVSFIEDDIIMHDAIEQAIHFIQEIELNVLN